MRFRDYNHVLTLDSGQTVHTGVVYLHGGPPGRIPRKFEVESFDSVPNTFRYSSFGVSGAPAWKYLRRPEPLAWALAVLMKPKRFASRAELALACLRRILGEQGLDEARRFKLLNFVHTYARLSEQTAPEYQALLEGVENQEAREMMMVTFADEMRAEGREEGLEKGLERMRDVVMELLAQRFGVLSERSRRAITSITSLDELAELAKKVFQVDSVEDLGLGLHA